MVLLICTCNKRSLVHGKRPASFYLINNVIAFIAGYTLDAIPVRDHSFFGLRLLLGTILLTSRNDDS